MSLKNSHTVADYLEWDSMLILIQKLKKDGDTKFSLLIQTGAYTGLRISDILNLKWKDVLDQEFIQLNEKKTKKYRKIKINETLMKSLVEHYSKLKTKKLNDWIFVNRFGTKPICTQFVNKKLKTLKVKYKIKVPNFSSHSLRKCFGRHVVEMSEYKEKALVLLSELFNHSSIGLTRRYLGLREAELQSVYDML
jgi:integrase